MTFPFQNCARSPSLFLAVSEVKISRQTTLGRFGFKKKHFAQKQRDGNESTRIKHKNIKLYCIYRCFNTQNYIYPFQNLSLGFILKIFLKFRKFQPRYCYKIYSYTKKSVLMYCIVLDGSYYIFSDLALLAPNLRSIPNF